MPEGKLTYRIIHDEYESRKTELQQRISDLLGVPWTININVRTIVPFANEDSVAFRTPGTCIRSFVEAAIEALRQVLEMSGDAGKQEMNSVCGAHTLVLGASYKANRRTEIVDGKWKLLFHPDDLGCPNVAGIAYHLEESLNIASPPLQTPQLSAIAQQSIATQWDSEIAIVREALADKLDMPMLRFEPNFEINYAKLRQRSGLLEDDWESHFGEYLRKYFESVLYWVYAHDCGRANMPQGPYAEAMQKKLIQFKVKDKLSETHLCNELVLEDGALLLQTTPESWGVNMNDIGQNIRALL